MTGYATYFFLAFFGTLLFIIIGFYKMVKFFFGRIGAFVVFGIGIFLLNAAFQIVFTK